MKQHLLTALCLLCTLASFGQDRTTATTSAAEHPEESLTLGVRAGLNLSNLYLSAQGTNGYMGSRTGFHVGVVADIPIKHNFYIQPGLYLQQKGFKRSLSSLNTSTEGSPLYIEVPILASLHLNLGKNIQLIGSLGPYFAYGIGGSGNVNVDGGNYYNNDYFDEYTRRFDFGLTLNAGLLFARHYYLGVDYSRGTINVNSENDDLTLWNSNVMISLGYNL